MRQSSDFDSFEQFIRQNVEAFEEVPSEQVWEGLTDRWDQKPPGFFRGDLFWLLLGILLLTGTALLGWHAIDGLNLEVSGPPLMSERKAEPLTISLNPSVPPVLSQQTKAPIIEETPSANTNSSVPTAQPSLTISQQERVSLLLDSSHDQAELPPISSVSPGSTFFMESKPELIDSTATFLPVENMTLVQSATQKPGKKVRTKKKKKTSKTKYRPTFGSEDWWSSPNSWKNGKSWDYQIGLSFGGDNTYRNRSLVPLSQERSSLTDFELRFEWVPNHRLRFSSGLGLKRTDFHHYFPVTDPSSIYNTVAGLGLPLDTANIQQMNNNYLGHTLFIPLDVWMFFTPPEKETQIFGGIGFQQSIWGRYRTNYQFFLMNEDRVIATSPTGASRNFLIRSYRVSAGVEQRLNKALRIRAQGSIGFNDLFRSSRFEDNVILGGNVSLYWASGRGPLRWRKQKRKRY